MAGCVNTIVHRRPLGYQLHVTRRVSATPGARARERAETRRVTNKNLHCGRYRARISAGSLREIVRACRRIYCEIRNVTFRGRRSVTIDAPTTRRDASGNAAG